MTRFAATVRTDIRLQYRQGFYFAALFMAVILIVLLRQVPADDLPWLLPLLVLSNVQINAFYFLAGLVLLEKGEGTLEAQVVTPLRTGEYLGSKVWTLTLLSLAENATLAMLVVGPGVAWVPFLAGIVAASVIFCLVGFLAVVRYDSINEFLMPSFLYIVVLSVPLVPYFGFLESPWFVLHPVSPSLLLMRAGFAPGSGGLLGAAALVWIVWAVGLALACRRAFLRFVVEQDRGHRG